MQALPAVQAGTDIATAASHEVTSAVVDQSNYQASYQAFRVGSAWYYTGFDEASELVEPLSATWLPNTPQWFVGLAHLSGYVVPVVDWASNSGATAMGTPSGAAASHPAPLFHLLFGRSQQRIAVAIHTLPFTVTTYLPPQGILSGDIDILPDYFAPLVDAILPWNDVTHTAQGSLALKGIQPPSVLYHLSNAMLAQWFARQLQD